MSENFDILDAPEDERLKGRRSWWSIVCSIICSSVLLIACLITFIEVDTVIFSAFPFVLISLFILIRAAIGISGVVIAVIIFLIIFIYDLSPAQAQKPIPPILALLSLIYSATSIVYMIREWKKGEAH